MLGFSGLRTLAGGSGAGGGENIGGLLSCADGRGLGEVKNCVGMPEELLLEDDRVGLLRSWLLRRD